MAHTTSVSPVRRLLSVSAASALVAVLALVFIPWQQLNVHALPALDSPQPVANSALVERVAYLALAGNCAGCHSNTATASAASSAAATKAIKRRTGEACVVRAMVSLPLHRAAATQRQRLRRGRRGAQGGR